MKREMVHIHQISVGPSWMDPIVLFLKEDILPEEKSEAKKVRRKAPRFWLSKDQKLYKRSFSGSHLLCIHPETSKLGLSTGRAGLIFDPTRIRPTGVEWRGRVTRNRNRNQSVRFSVMVSDGQVGSVAGIKKGNEI